MVEFTTTGERKVGVLVAGGVRVLFQSEPIPDEVGGVEGGAPVR
jgi:hypothetical protein